MSALTYAKLTGRLIVANLVVQIVIIATGGAVRLTGSGLGCSSWPNCEPGEFSPQFHAASSIHPYVEWGNRLMGAVVVIVALAVAVLVFFAARRGVRPPPSGRLLWLATVPLLLSLVQAVLGGLTVVLHLHPAVVGSHFLFSAALVWISTWLVIEWYRPSRRGCAPWAGPWPRWPQSWWSSACWSPGPVRTPGTTRWATGSPWTPC